MTVADMTARIARNLARARGAAGLTQDQAAQLLDPPVRPNEISRWEHGYVRPREPRLLEIAALYRVDPGWLYLDHANGST